jgi:hypothetical protein
MSELPPPTPSRVDDPLKSLADVTSPDERQANLVQSLADVHALLVGLVLDERVPVDVRQLFETSKNVRLYAYFAYRFHQVAETVAYQALERGLRTRWNDEVAKLASIEDAEYRWPTLSPLLLDAAAQKWVRNAGFSGRFWRAWNSLISERSIAAFQAMTLRDATQQEIAEPTKEEVEARAAQIDVVKILTDHLPELRNRLAHGSKKLSPTSDYVLRDVCDALNMIFDGSPSVRTGAPSHSRASMHGAFKKQLSRLEPKRSQLMSMIPTTRDTLPKGMPVKGIYLFSEAGRHLYVGRSNTLRRRIGRHCRESARVNMASFAFRLAKEQCGIGPATYRKGYGRADVVLRDDVAKAFVAAKRRIRAMEIRFVAEEDPMTQMLLEAYVAVVHNTPYNDFDNH